MRYLHRNEHMGAKVNLSCVLFLAALGGLLFGFDIAIITGAGPFLTEHFKLSDLSLSRRVYLVFRAGNQEPELRAD